MHICETLDGNLQAPNFRLNDSNRNLNANNVDNDWNDRNRFVFVRNSISFITRLRRSRVMFLSASLFEYLTMPATKHFSNLNKLVGKCDVLFCLHDVCGICNTKQYFCGVERLNRFLDVEHFLFL